VFAAVVFAFGQIKSRHH